MNNSYSKYEADSIYINWYPIFTGRYLRCFLELCPLWEQKGKGNKPV